MKILDILSAPWAIEPTKLLEIHAIYDTHLRGDKIDLASVEARLGRPLANEQKEYEIRDGVAVLPIDGVIAKRMNLFSQISGGTSSQMVGNYLQSALADPAVHSIILAIDSPGGTVDGTQLLADAIFAARSVKPIVALGSGTMASAAYWMGSAAQAVYITDGTTNVGSIGTVMTHTDVSQSDAARGIKKTEIVAGKYKRIASENAPLTETGQQALQSMVDYSNSMFVDAVARNRGVTSDAVIADMADGRIFIGQQAIDAGLVDGITTLDALVAKLNQERGQSTSKPRAGAALTSTIPKGSTMTTLTAEQVAADHPAIAAAFRAEGATAERARIQTIEAQIIPGHEALINSLKFDGKSTAGDAALAVLAAERTSRTAQAAALAGDAPKPLAHQPAATVPVDAAAKAQADKDALAAMPIEDRCKAEWTASADLRSEFGSLAGYMAYSKAVSQGSVKILASKTA